VKSRLLAAALCLCLAGAASSARSDDDDITEASVRAHLEFLASDAMNGRGSGTRDEQIAAEYLGGQMRRWAIEPLGDDGGFVQRVTIERAQLAKPPVLSFGGSRFTHGSEVLVTSMSAPKQSGPLQKYEKGAEIKAGAAVLLPEGLSPRDMASMTAAAILLVPETPQSRQQWSASAARPVTLGARLAGATAAAARPARVTLDKATYATLSALAAGTSIAVEGDPGAPQRTYTWNAIGRIRGRDAARANDVIVLSAHLDHIGARAPRPGDAADADLINNGADDDASGCVAVLEIAKALADEKPKRTIVFAFFGSEEAGGFGSRYFADKPVVPLPQIVANLQFEMIGRPDKAVPDRTLWLTGYERSTLGPSLARHGARLVQDPHPEQNFFERSDNIQFARRGVVAHTVSSYNLHKEYHTVEDETRLIDYAHMTEAIRSMVKPIEWLANSTFKPDWLPGKKP
jgi:peptidase M28-like protein